MSRRIRLQHDLTQKSSSNLEQKIMMIETNLNNISENNKNRHLLTESTIRANFTEIQNSIKNLNKMTKQDYSQLAIRTSSLINDLEVTNNKLLENFDQTDDIKEKQQKIDEKLENLNLISTKIAEIETVIKNIKLRQASTTDQLNDNVLKNVESLGVRVDQFQSEIQSIQD